MNAWVEKWFDLVFVILMVGLIGPTVYWWKSRLLSRVEPKIREDVNLELRSTMRNFTAAWLLSFVGLTTWIVLALVGIHPLGHPVSMYWPIFAAFHLVWWLFVPRIVKRLNSHLEQRGAVAPQRRTEAHRTATLTPRRVSDYLPRHGILLAATVAILGPASIAVAYVLHPVQDAMAIYPAASFGATGLITLGLWCYGMRFSLSDRLPMGDSVDDGDRDALRKLRIRVMYWMMIIMSLVFFGAGLLSLEVSRGTIDGRVAGLIGGIAGSIVGLLGGALGLAGSIRAHRLREKSTADASSRTEPAASAD